MQHTKKLSNTLRDLLSLIEEEAQHNPRFADKLEKVLKPTQTTTPKKSRSQAKELPAPPDVFKMLNEKGDEEFRYWVRNLDLVTLKSVVKLNGYDPQQRSRKWIGTDKFVDLIVDQTIARRNRGSAFLENREES